MREIKFRAWCEKKKHMSPPKSLQQEISEWFESGHCGHGLLSSNIGHLEYEQYTGLKDKNGKEIYENDICNVKLADGRTVMADIKMTDGCWELDFMFPIGRYGQDRDYLKCHTVNHAVEIIGNIHENPELLPA